MQAITNALKGIFWAIVSPTKAFKQQDEQPVNPFIVFGFLFVIGLVLSYLIAPFTLQAIKERMLERASELSAEQMRQMGKLLTLSALRTRMIASFIVIFTAKTALRGLLFMVAAPLVEANISFENGVLISLYGDVITTLESILRLLIVWLFGVHSVMFSPGAFLSPEQLSTFWGSLLASLNIFSIWAFYVIGIGIAIIGRTSKRKALLFSYALWFLWLLGTMFLKTSMPHRG